MNTLNDKFPGLVIELFFNSDSYLNVYGLLFIKNFFEWTIDMAVTKGRIRAIGEIFESFPSKSPWQTGFDFYETHSTTGKLKCKIDMKDYTHFTSMKNLNCTFIFRH